MDDSELFSHASPRPDSSDVDTTSSDPARKDGETTRRDWQSLIADGRFGGTRVAVQGWQLGRFQIVRLAGRGGMGLVYLAQDTILDRPVALKVPRIEVFDSESQRQRFLREAQIAARLKHGNLVDIYEVGADGDLCYLACQWCSGGDLNRWLQRHPHPLEPVAVAQFIATIALAIEHCHQNGILHLDLKPPNILLDTDAERFEDLQPLVADFGVARVIEAEFSITTTGLFLGTPCYMSPEQLLDDRSRVGPAADVFSLGVILYELLYRQRPLASQTLQSLVRDIRSLDRLTFPAQPSVPEDLRTIIQQCLEREPADRYSSAAALAADLKAFATGRPITARSPSRWNRFVRWCRHESRIKHAGLISAVVQGLVLFSVLGVVVSRLLGFPPLAAIDLGQLLWQFFSLILPLHAANLWLAWKSLCGRAWSVPLGFASGVIFLAFPLAVLGLGFESPFSIYVDNQLALLIGYVTLLGGALSQTLGYALALPAALRRRP